VKIVGIHQPQYLPWLGLADRVSKSDLFVILDNVPYSKNYFYNRNKIKGPNGPQWLTIPVLSKGQFGQSFTEMRIDNSQDWGEKHRKSIYQAYAKAPFFGEYSGYFYEALKKDWNLLADICVETFRFLLTSFGINKEIVRASELKAEGKKEGLIINICRKVGATHYLSGPDGRNYLDISRWDDNGIKVDFQNYAHPIYPQLHGDFVPNMSAIDLLFNCGKDGFNVLASGQPEYFPERTRQ